MRASNQTKRFRDFLAFVVACAIATAPGPMVAAQHTLEEVVAGLHAKDVATRLRAVQILQDAGHLEAAGPLSAAVSDPDDRVKLAAIAAERSLFTNRPVERRKKIGFVVEVRTPEVSGEAFAAAQLALLPRAVPPEVLTALAEAIHASNLRVRLEALNTFAALAPLGGPRADGAIRSGISWTIEALRRGNRAEQVGAAWLAGRALKDCGVADLNPVSTPVAPGFSPASPDVCAEAGNALVDAVNNHDPQVHRASMVSLGQLRYQNAADALADQLSFYVRGADAHAALVGLAGIGHPTSIEIFKRLLTHSDPDFRRLAVEGIARAGERDDLSALQQLQQVEKSNVVLLAVHFAELKLGAPGAAPNPLVAAVRDPALRPLALQYLLDLGPSIGSALAQALSGEDAETRTLVAEVLGFSRDAKVIPALEAAAEDPDAVTARAARIAIDRITLAQAWGTASR